MSYDTDRLAALEANYKAQAILLRQTIIRIDHLEKASIKRDERLDRLESALRSQGLDIPEYLT